MKRRVKKVNQFLKNIQNLKDKQILKDSKFLAVTSVVIIIFLMAVFAFAGGSAPKLEGEIRLATDSAGSNMAKSLAKTFMQKHKGVTVHVDIVEDVELARFKLTNGQEDAVLAYQHPMNRLLSEETSFVVVGKDKLIPIVHTNNPTQSVTKEQLQDIYLGKVSNWRDVGGSSGKISAAAFSDSTAMTSILKDVLDVNKLRYHSSVTSVKDFSQMQSTVENDSKAIGYTLQSQMPKEGIKPLLILKNNVNETKVTEAEEDQTVEWCVIFKNRGQSAEAKAFIEFIKSKGVDKIFMTLLTE